MISERLYPIVLSRHENEPKAPIVARQYDGIIRPKQQLRVSIDLKDGTASSVAMVLRFRDDSDQEVWGQATPTTTAAWVKTTFIMDTLLPNDVDGEFQIFTNTNMGGNDIEMRNLTVTQIGAVLQLEQDGITDAVWFDKSGNNLDGN